MMLNQLIDHYNSILLFILIVTMIHCNMGTCTFDRRCHHHHHHHHHHRIHKRVIGGEDARHEANRFMVQLVDRHNQTICSGSIVAPDSVLTAAHCV